jgi:hypothetical protein
LAALFYFGLCTAFLNFAPAKAGFLYWKQSIA